MRRSDRRSLDARGSSIMLAIACTCIAACGEARSVSESIHDLPRLNVVEEMRIGNVDSPDLGFSRISSVDVDRDGNIYALEAMASEIRVFDPHGNLLHRIGRRGGGPGEFENIPRFGVKGDTLWSYESPAGRITLFDRQGRIISTGRTTGASVPVRTGTGYVTPVSMRDDGLFVGWFTRIASRRGDPVSAPADGVPRIVFDASGAVVDTMGTLPSAPPRMVPPENYDAGRWQRVTIGGSTYSVPDPPTELPTWLPLDDGHVIVDVPYASTADGATFSVTRILAAGDTLYHRVLSYEPQRYTEDRLMAAAGRQPTVIIDGQLRENRTDDAAINAIRARMDFPEFMLPVVTARALDDESVWLQLVTEPEEPHRWVVLDDEGEVRGRIELPARSWPLWTDGNTVLAAVPDELDVPWLVRYRITAAERGT